MTLKKELSTWKLFWVLWKMDIYNKLGLNDLLDEDEINEGEQGFMLGYIEAFN